MLDIFYNSIIGMFGIFSNPFLHLWSFLYNHRAFFIICLRLLSKRKHIMYFASLTAYPEPFIRIYVLLSLISTHSHSIINPIT